MNDLFSTSSFKKYTDLNRQARMDDIEGGRRPDLDTFFKEAESIKEDLNGLDQLYRRLQSLNEDTKTAHNAGAMKELRARMDADTVKVLRQANAVKRKLEAVDRANAASRNLPGCGPGSSVDRTRTSVLAGLGTKLKDLMDGFQELRARIAAEYKETVGRRYFTVTGERPDDDTVERLISTGESESILHKAIQDQGRGQIMDAISEMQERHDAVKEIEKGLIELHQVFLDMAALVEAQGQELNNIESHVAHASSFVRRGAGELAEAKECQRSSRKWFCLAVLLGAALLLLLLMPILITVIRPI